jgi:hypothetical protein
MLKSPWLAFASPSRIAAAIGYLVLHFDFGREFHMFFAKVLTTMFWKTNKTTKLMNHLGGSGCLGLC